MDSMRVSVARRNVRLDGVKYELTAICINGNYQATWRCPKCNVGGSSATTFPRPTGALDWAEGCARVHEQEAHAA
jgi:hypothetical protein